MPLEDWARELKKYKSVLETGVNQSEAIRFYPKMGYKRIPNFDPYEGVTTSYCFEKKTAISPKIIVMLLVSTPTVPNKNIESVLGIARGSTVRASNVGKDIFAGLKNIIGGEISEYTQLQAQSREQALQRMEDDARKMGANAVVNVRLTTSMVMQGCSEILAYGTAVTLKD